MQLKNDYETFIKSHLFFPKDPNNLEIKSFEEFLEKNVIWAGNEAKILNDFLTKERARPNQASFKERFLDELVQKNYEKKPVHALERIRRIFKWGLNFPDSDLLWSLDRIKNLYNHQNIFVKDFFLLNKNGSFLFHTDNWKEDHCPSFIGCNTFLEKEYEEED